MDSEQNKDIVAIDPKSGFCFGVINAIQQAEKALEQHKTLYCLGDIVHNGAEVARLNQKGLVTVTHEQFKELKDCTVLLRAHGEPPETYETARRNNITIIDATCPVVLNLQKNIKKAYHEIKDRNGQILIFGKQGHAEVIGLLGQTENTAKVISSPADLDGMDFSKPTILFSQTTQDIHTLNLLKERIGKECQAQGNGQFTFHDTICRRVANRENELKEFASRYDIVFFVSGKKSSNGKVLFNICKEVNGRTFFVSNIEDIDAIRIPTGKSVGICGATSTPKWLMEAIADKIQAILAAEPVHEKYMRRCIELAQSAFGNTYPNPMVGSVIVHNGEIIGEGFHHKAGEPHAEVNAIQSVQDPSLLPESTIYVCLEPCAHFGKTPPCADLIVAKQFKQVVVGCVDSFSKVAGKGIERIRQAGIDVVVNVLEDECRFLNRRFFTYHEENRPYIILKWAQTKDGFIDRLPAQKESSKGVRITDDECQKRVHLWRSQEQAILVGATTARCDDPSLTTRLIAGSNPLRVLWDLHDSVPETAALKDGTTPTVVFTSQKKDPLPNVEYVPTTTADLLPTTLATLHAKGIQSLIVEGGTKTLQTFIDAGMWDEARVFTTEEHFGTGVPAPQLQATPAMKERIGNAELEVYYRQISSDFSPFLTLNCAPSS